jgi:PPM family protein phosphatase
MSDAASQGITVEVWGCSDIGRVRSHNEDYFLIADVATPSALPRPPSHAYDIAKQGLLALVADGMGGAAAGEVASQMATDIIYSYLVQRWGSEANQTGARLALLLKEALEEANAHLHSYASANDDVRGMGTTATAAGLLGDHVYLAHVGDSRAYLVRNKRAHQLTRDHSLIQRLVETGDLTEEEVTQSTRRNILLQALGPAPTVMVDLTCQQLHRGDVLLLCSDGLTTALTKEELAAAVTTEPTLPEVCDKLIGLANERGGLDNATVILARFDGDGLRLEPQDEQIGHRLYPLSDPETRSVESLGSYGKNLGWRVVAGGALAASLLGTAFYLVMRGH